MTKHHGHKGSMDGVLFDGHLIQEVEHGRAARVTTPDGAVYVLTDQHDVPADVFPAHVTALVLSIVRSA